MTTEAHAVADGLNLSQLDRPTVEHVIQALIDILDDLEDCDPREIDADFEEDDPLEDSDVDEDDDPAEEDDHAEDDDPGGEDPNEDNAGGCFAADGPYLGGRAEARLATKRWLKALEKRRAALGRSEVPSC